jgi:cytochrome c oxidase subunit IV
MKRFKAYLKKLNWYGFVVVMLICMAGAPINKCIHSIIEWLFLVVIIGIPFLLLFLFIGKED